MNTALHKNILVTILKNVFTDPSLGPELGFKGGTAALLFYNLNRFSVDLDFDLLDTSKEAMVFDAVHAILQNFGTVKARKKRYSIFFLLSYKDKRDGAQNIKVEINKRTFGSTYEVKHYLGVAMRVMVQADMAAHKLVAMHERMGTTNRDIYDVWFFLHHHWPVNTHIIELRMGVPYKDFLKMCIHDLERTSNRSILSGLGELLDEKQKIWVKSKLLSETIFLLQLALSHSCK